MERSGRKLVQEVERLWAECGLNSRYRFERLFDFSAFPLLETPRLLLRELTNWEPRRYSTSAVIFR